jgi:hypothetical protein
VFGEFLEGLAVINASRESAGGSWNLWRIPTPESCRASIILRMAKILSMRAIVRRRGNPNWERPVQPTSALATEFEVEIQRLGLTKEAFVGSGPLQDWCKRNKNRCYIPEWLLGAWDIHVDPTLSQTPQSGKWQLRSTARKPVA